MSFPSIASPPSPQERIERLVVATSALITEVSLQGVLRRVVEAAAEVIGARYAAIGVLGPDGRVMETFTTYGIDPELRARIGEGGRARGAGDGPAAAPSAGARAAAARAAARRAPA